jgi:hypothetical protein
MFDHRIRVGEEHSRAPDAAQRPFDDALQRRGAHAAALYRVAFWVPALRRNARALQRVRDTEVRNQVSLPDHLLALRLRPFLV